MKVIFEQENSDGIRYADTGITKDEWLEMLTDGTIECCYWNDWEGLVRETLKVTYANNSVISITQTKAEVLCEYDCGICF